MAFPVPGDTNILGIVQWFNSDVGCGVVEAFASLYGTPHADVRPDPLRFPFLSTGSFSEGQHVIFDVVAGTHAPRAVNVV